MRFSCDKCQARYTIADEKVRGKIVAVKCSKCGNKITVNGKSLVPAQEEVPEERTRVASLSDMEALRANPEAAGLAPPPPPEPPPPAAEPALQDGWHAIIDRQQVGPLSAADVRGHIEKGKINSRTYMWRDGQGDWKRAADLPGLAEALAPKPVAAPPPPPPPPPPAQARPVPKNGSAQQVQRPVEPEPQERVEEEEERPTVQRSDLDVASLLAAPGLDEEPASRPAPEEPAPQESLGDSTEPTATAPRGLEPAPATPASNGDLNSLLFDGAAEPPPHTNPAGKPIDLASEIAGDLDGKAGAKSDPFAAVPDNPNISKPGEIGEQTRFFMQKAGVNRRNPPWKIALFVVLLIGLPVAVLYGLSKFNVPFLQIETSVDENTGQTVTASVFSSEGFGSLRDRLMGKKPAPVVPVAPKPKQPRPVAQPKPDPKPDEGPVVAKPDIDMGSTMTDEQRQQMKDALNSIGNKGGPKVDPSLLEASRPHVDGKAGLDEKAISEVYGKNVKAFQGCVETELRRNPAFKGGKVNITITIGSSGVVTKAAIDKADIDQSGLGACLKEKAKRMLFPSFEGDAFDVEIPLILTRGG